LDKNHAFLQGRKAAEKFSTSARDVANLAKYDLAFLEQRKSPRKEFRFTEGHTFEKMEACGKEPEFRKPYRKTYSVKRESEAARIRAGKIDVF
jgi:hypothetical protein